MEEKEILHFQELGLIYESVIAQGGFGVIYLVFSIQYQTYFALKKIPEQRFNQAEIDCLTNLDHPNTINLYNCYKFDGYVYMLMEYCPNDLQTLLKDDIEIDEEVMRKYCHDILVAIKACHDHNIAHGDIKPSNFLIDKYGRIKVCDFGLSSVMEDATTSCAYHGTLFFMSPELVKKLEYNPMKSDVWALGVTFYYMATRSYPFYSESHDILIKLIEVGSYPAFKVKNNGLRHLISRCLEIDPEKRATIEELLQMPYFDKISTTKLTKSSKFLAARSHEIFMAPTHSLRFSLPYRLERNSLVPHKMTICRPCIARK